MYVGAHLRGVCRVVGGVSGRRRYVYLRVVGSWRSAEKKWNSNEEWVLTLESWGLDSLCCCLPPSSSRAPDPPPATFRHRGSYGRSEIILREEPGPGPQAQYSGPILVPSCPQSLTDLRTPPPAQQVQAKAPRGGRWVSLRARSCQQPPMPGGLWGTRGVPSPLPRP